MQTDFKGYKPSYLKTLPGFLNYRTTFEVILILLVGLVPLIWFKDSLLINFHDFNFSLRPIVNRFFYTWEDIHAPGSGNTRHLAEIFYRSFIALPTKLGISLATMEKMYFVLVFISSGLSMYYLTSILVPKEQRGVAPLASAFFYMFNPFIMNDLWHILFLVDFYALFPLIFALYIKGLREKRFFIYSFLISAIFATILSHAMVNPVSLVIGSLILFSYLIAYLIDKRKDRHKVINAFKFNLYLAIVWLFLNSWWLFPQISTLSQEFSYATGATEDIGITTSSILQVESKRSTLLNVFRLGGGWGFNGEYKGDAYVSYAEVYSTPFFQIIGFLIPILVFYGLLKKGVKHSFYFGVLAIIGLFLIKGTQPPFGGAFLWIFKNIPLFAIFRHFQDKFSHIVVLSYAFLFGMGINYLINFLKSISNTYKNQITAFTLVVIFVAIFGIYAYPMWTGEVISKGGEIIPSGHIKVPEYYTEADIWLKKQKDDFRIFSLPFSKLFYAVYNWEYGYVGGDPSGWLFSKPTITSNTGKSFEIPLQVAKVFSEGELKEEISKTLALLNVKYLLYHNDTNWEYIKDHPWWFFASPKKDKSILNRQKGIYFENSFGKLDFYKISDDYFLPHIYPAHAITSVASDIGSLIPLTYTSYLDGYPALAFTEQQNKSSLMMVMGERVEAKGEEMKGNKILFVNSNFNDLIVDLSKVESQFENSRFKVESKGIYEVWVENIKGLEDKVLRFEVGGKEFEFGGKRIEDVGKGYGTKSKWVKGGVVELDKGKHRISVRSQNKEELKELPRDMEIVVVPKEKFEEYKDIISRKFENYLFYIDKDKTEDMLKDEEKLRDIKLNSDNPFRIGKQQFYIPENGNYSLKTFIKPKRDFLDSGFVGSSSNNSSRAYLEAVFGWDIKGLNTIYKQDISDDGMHIDAYFQGKGDIKESVVFTKKFSDIDIKKRPYLALSFEMEDPSVQEVEMDIMYIDPYSWFFKNKKLSLKVRNKQYVVNLYEKIKKAISNGHWVLDKREGLFVKEVILKLKKKNDIDLSNNKDKKYRFSFRNLAFLKTQPILAEFGDKLAGTYLPDSYYYFDRNGDLKYVDFPEQVPWYVKAIYKLHLDRFIDLKETPILSLSFPNPELVSSQKSEVKSFPDEWRVVLGLDFDGDEKEDNRIETLVPAAGLVDRKLLLSVHAYEIAKEKFPDKKTYNLLSIGTSHPEDKEILYQTIMSKKLIRYREHIYKPIDFKKDADVLEIDGKRYNLTEGEGLKAESEKKEVKGDDNEWVEFKNVYLTIGEHSLNVLENDRFKVEMVEIKQVESEKLKVESYKTPKIEFKKINPTRYIVDVRETKGPFTLVFSESFHEGWKAYVRKSGVRSQESGGKTIPDKQLTDNEPWSALWSVLKDRDKRIEIKDHFVVNGYANGWIVPAGQFKVQSSRFKVEEKDQQDFQIVLEYKQQRLFEIGVLISAATLLGCIGYLGYGFVRKRRKNE